MEGRGKLTASARLERNLSLNLPRDVDRPSRIDVLGRASNAFDDQMTSGQHSLGVGGEGDELDALLHFLHRERGFDFTGYKRTSVMRRVLRRVAAVGAASLTEYKTHLERSPDELPELLTVLLINVTAFFRDRAAWEALAAHLPSVIDLESDAPVRVWSAGCSSGEEPYTLAMMLRELLGEEAYSRRVKIYATDIDDGAIATARSATYPSHALEDIPPHLVEKYFSASGDHFTLASELRSDIVFGRHDLLRDAPLSQVDLLACRNVLMYFNPPTQERVLESFRFALKPTGLLFLGQAEMLLSRSRLFVPLDLKLRLFRPKAGSTPPATASDGTPTSERVGAEGRGRAYARRSAFEVAPVAQILTDGLGGAAVDMHAVQEELRATKQSLLTMNEQLQSVNEELETLNEELQSTNEELESTSEELESTNEELQTINEELRQRGTELNRMSTLFAAVLTRIPVGVVVLDRELHVTVWNATMTEYSGVRAHEAMGKLFPTLALAFESSLLRDIATSLRGALKADAESRRTIDCVKRSGEKVTCEVRVGPLLGPDGSGVVVIVGEVS